MKPFEILPVHFNWRGTWKPHPGWWLFFKGRARWSRRKVYVPEFN